MPVFWWMEFDLVSLKGRAVASSVFWDAYGFGVALGSLSANVQGCAPVLLRIGMGHPALDLAGVWVGLGLSVEMEAFGRAPMSCEVRSSLVVQSPGVESPTPGVQAQPLPIASRPHGIEDRTPRLMVK